MIFLMDTDVVAIRLYELASLWIADNECQCLTSNLFILFSMAIIC